MMVTLDAVLVCASDVVSTRVAEETVLLHMGDGIYFGLDPVGTRVWELLQQPRSLADVCSTILDEYDVDPGRCHEDIMRLADRMLDRKLLHAADPARS